MALKITITDAGRAALINANKSGTRAVSIISVGVSATAITADKSATSLANEIKRITAISGEVTAADAIHLTAKDDGDSIYTVRSFALYLDDGTLFAIYGQSSPILEKSAAAMLLLQLDIRFADIDATQIQFGNLDFINPAATEKTAGITRLTALGEAEQSIENIAVSPAELRRYAEKLARVADVLAATQKLDDVKVNRGGDTMTGSLRVMQNLTVDQIITAHAMLHLISGNGQNALDIHSDDDGIARMYAKNGNVDYQQFLAFNPQGNLDFNSPTGACLINGQLIWNRNNDGAGSGLDADFWRGLSPEHFATADDRNNLQDQINNRIRGDYGVVDGGKRGYAAYNLNGRIAFCAKNEDGTDDWIWLPNAIELQNLSDTISKLNQHLDDVKVNRGGDIMTGSLRVMQNLTVDQLISAHAMLHLISGNGQNALDIHSDDDGIARMYAKNGNVDYQQFLAFNPQGNLDFLSPSGQAFINSHEICHRGNDGAGSGWDMDFFRGNAPEHFATADDRNNLQDQINNRIRGDYGVVEGGKRGYAAYNLNGRIAFCAKNQDGTDDWIWLPNAIELQNLSDTISKLNQHLDDVKVNRGGDIMTGSLRVMQNLTVDQLISAHTMLHLISGNGLNGLDLHADDDGSVRMYGKNGNTGYQLFLAYNPQGNLDFLSPSGQAFINSHEICHRGNDGAGSGWDMDFFRGNAPEHFATSDDLNNFKNEFATDSNNVIRLPNNFCIQTFIANADNGSSINFPEPFSEKSITIQIQEGHADWDCWVRPEDYFNDHFIVSGSNNNARGPQPISITAIGKKY